MVVSYFLTLLIVLARFAISHGFLLSANTADLKEQL